MRATGQHQMAWFFRLSNLLLTISGVGVLLLAFTMEESRAEFALNFQENPTARDPAGFVINCNRAGGPTPLAGGCINGDPTNTRNIDPEKTPFLLEYVTDSATGVRYWHMIVGDPSKGFAQETYSGRGCANCWTNGLPGSSSGGSVNNGGFPSLTNPAGSPGPLGPIGATPSAGSGTGSGNPEATQIRQVIGVAGNELTQEFLKGSFLTKPKITQTVTTPDLVSQFQVDMSAIPYKGAAATTTPAVIVNKVTFTDPNVSGNFDMATQKQTSQVTAGQYTWATGSGIGGSSGTYSYLNGNFNLNAIDWASFYNPAQNTCWSYKQNPGTAPCTP